MEGQVTRKLGTVTPQSSLADVLALFKAGREWSCEVDEQLRREGITPLPGVLGMPVAQTDAIIVILERTLDEVKTAEASCAAALAHVETRDRQREGKAFALGVSIGVMLFVSAWALGLLLHAGLVRVF